MLCVFDTSPMMMPESWHFNKSLPPRMQPHKSSPKNQRISDSKHGASRDSRLLRNPYQTPNLKTRKPHPGCPISELSSTDVVSMPARQKCQSLNPAKASVCKELGTSGTAIVLCLRGRAWASGSRLRA